MNVKTSLLREKFVITGVDPKQDDDALKEPAHSNRMPISLKAGDMPSEDYVVRAQNMHLCARMVAHLIRDYDKGGPLLHRVIPYKWEEVWAEVVGDYELAYNPDRWVCVYHQGKPVFHYGDRHPFLDVIEHCDTLNSGHYDSSVKLAEEAFRKAGKNLRVGYDSNMAILLNLEKTVGRCGMILRAPDRTTTFNYHIESVKNIPVNPSQCIRVAAALLEGIQLGFMIGIANEKQRSGLVDTSAQEARQAREAKRRIGSLNAEISAMETHYKVRYRPERPDFNRIILEAEKIAPKYLEALIAAEALKDDDD
ncbi:MAG: hypothetical protein H6858_01755 [Rhodospirillales bacterium]|nr:hypothetical protein [Alphaproteobacteria bacterium]MCB9976308.1 hypothetical protein [Rhodospirillales bacterium]